MLSNAAVTGKGVAIRDTPSHRPAGALLTWRGREWPGAAGCIVAREPTAPLGDARVSSDTTAVSVTPALRKQRYVAPPTLSRLEHTGTETSGGAGDPRDHAGAQTRGRLREVRVARYTGEPFPQRVFRGRSPVAEPAPVLRAEARVHTPDSMPFACVREPLYAGRSAVRHARARPAPPPHSRRRASVRQRSPHGSSPQEATRSR